MKPLKTGDPCPCCGQPIESSDPELLRFLSDFRDALTFLEGAESTQEQSREAADGEM